MVCKTTTNNKTTIKQQSDFSGALSPIDAINWLESCFSKCISSFLAQCDGGLFSSVPKTLEPDEHDDLINQSARITLASQLANSMYKMRTPVLSHDDGGDLFSMPSPDRPGPSLPGFAFSCCAVTMPLLKLRSFAI